MYKLVALVTLGLFLGVNAHMAIWTPSMWGREPNNVNANQAVTPLQDRSFNDWWMHGPLSLNDPPASDAITQLPAGGTIDFEISGNKAYSSMGPSGLWHHPGQSSRVPPSSNPWYAEWTTQNIHSPKRTDVAGCALGIAYKSDVHAVRPEDFVIMSVVKDCIARPLQAFDIPYLPACPNNKCICSWFWIHNSIGGTDQMYMTPFQCNVANASRRVIGKPSPPVRCDGKPSCYLYPNWGNITTVCRKPLTPMYWANSEGNNMQNPTNAQCAPIYSEEYGYPDGAQHQIFVDDFKCIQNEGDTLISNSNKNSISTSPLAAPSCATKLSVQSDGNVVLADVNSGRVYWSSNTNGKGVAPYRLTMQNDGNLVLTDSHSSAIWTSGSAGKGLCAPYSLKVRDPAKVTVVDCNGEHLWSN
jgi:hypothetical protein